METTSLESKKTGWQKLTTALSRKVYKPTSATFYGYDDVLLKMYFDIASNGDTSVLQKTGKPDSKKCNEVWEEIIRQNSKATSNKQYEKYLSTLRQHRLFIKEYTLIKAMLTKLSFVVDKECIDYLNIKGYRIKTTNSVEYAESLSEADKRVENLKTKATMKQNEIHEFFKVTEGEAKKSSGGLHKTLAIISFHLGYEVKDDITLARYNEYNILVREKIKAQRNIGKGRKSKDNGRD